MQLQADSIDLLVKALLKSQQQIRHAVMDSSNPAYKSRYASIESTIDAIKPSLNENGIVVNQLHLVNEHGLFVVTQLTHESGQWMRSFTPVIMDKNTAQGQGSGLSYARRYALQAICCLGQDDDDGNSASGIDHKHDYRNKDFGLKQARPAQPAKETASVAAQKEDRKQEKIESPADYKMPFGKVKGKTLGELGALEVSNSLGWVKTKAKQEFRDSQMAKEFVFWAEQFLRKNPVDDLDKALDGNKPDDGDIAPPDWQKDEPWPA